MQPYLRLLRLPPELDGQVCGKACDQDCANLFDMADSVATADITMYGETHLDRDFGAILDGVGDFLTFEDTGFTASGSFTIGFWFTRNTECANPGRWQYLYSEAEDPDAEFDMTAFQRMHLSDDAGTDATAEAEAPEVELFDETDLPDELLSDDGLIDAPAVGDEGVMLDALDLSE